MIPVLLPACVLLLLAGLSAQPPTARDAILATAIVNPDATYPECHASTVVEVSPGQFAAAWFGGTKERHPDVGIWFARREEGRWLPAVEVADGRQEDGRRFPTWNPVLFAAPGGGLHLFYKVGPSASAWWGMVRESRDGGLTWSAARRLPPGIIGPVKNKPVVLPDGAWLAGSSTEGNPDGWRLHLEVSRDAGRTWTRVGPVDKGPGLDAIQPSVLLHPGGLLQALARTRQGVVAQTWSRDGGATWSMLTATELPNPNSGTDAITLADGRHLIVYNHSAHRAGEAKGNRHPLDIAVSRDGLAWTRVLTLESEPVRSGYAYPAVIQSSDGKLHVTYTADRKRIRHVILDPARLEGSLR
jgi:predicted neuraminidase